METSRFEALIDAILAIIITIIVMEIPLPETTNLSSLLALYPEFISYTLSFVICFNFWNYNNNIFSIVNKVNHKVMWYMGFSLFALSFLPYLTIFVSENFYSFIAHAAYGMDFIICGILSIFTANELKKSDKGNIALQVAVRNNKPLYYSILITTIGFILGYFYPPAITLCCLISIPTLWIFSKRQIK